MKRLTIGMLTMIACLLLAATAQGDHNSLSFDGVNDYVAVPHNPALALTNTATIETWVKPVYSTNIRVICARTAYWGNPHGYWFMMWGQTMRLMWGNGNTDYIDVFASSQIPADTWSHVAVTYEGTTVKWYINGTLNRTSTVASVTLAARTDSLLFGRANNSTSDSYWFNGSLDRLRIWNYARTQEQIQACKDSVVAPGTSGLVAQYTFNQGTAGGDNSGITTLYDSSGTYGKSSPVDGILRNFTLSGTSSNWVVSAAPAAVEMVDFTATGLPGRVRLAWSTASENNSASWLIERGASADDGYTEIGRLPASGNNAVGATYSFTDDKAEPGRIHYYRIAEQELNGTVTYYGPVQAMAGVVSPAADKTIRAWPNPFRASVRLQCGAQSQLQVYDLTGRLVRNLASSAGEVVWDGLNDDGLRLGPGVYFVRVDGSGGTVTRKVIKLQ